VCLVQATSSVCVTLCASAMLQLSGAGQRCRFRPDASSVGAWGFSQACPRTLAESGAVGCSRDLTFHRQMCPEGLPGISLLSVDSGALPGLSAPDGAPKLDLSGGGALASGGSSASSFRWSLDAIKSSLCQNCSTLILICTSCVYVTYVAHFIK
jgi:hypothetical protein